jgi:hypothetical protein
MSAAADKDRKPTEFPYERWGEVVVLRPISARELVELEAVVEAIDEDDASRRSLRMKAGLLAATVQSPQWTADEWAEVSPETLNALCDEAMRINGMLEDDAAKKNSAAT